MDTITQAVLGASVAEAGWRRELGAKAIPMGIIGGLLPDIDILGALTGPWNEMLYHRGFTHSIFFAPLVAPLLGWIGWRWSGKQGKYWSWVHMLFWAIFTHPLLDICTTYGTQFLYPMSNHRFAIDAVAIIDPLYTFPLLGALLFARWRRHNLTLGRRVVQAMLIGTTLYLGLGYYQSQRAIQYTKAQLPKQFKPEEVRATPTLFNIWVWRVLARNHSGDMHVGLISNLASPPTLYSRYLPHSQDPLVKRTFAHPKGQLTSWFAMDMLSSRVLKLTTPKPRTLVYLDDQRYGPMAKLGVSLWGARATYDDKGKLLEITRYNRRPGSKGREGSALSLGKEFKTLGALLRGKPHPFYKPTAQQKPSALPPHKTP